MGSVSVTILELLALGVALGTDAFSVSLAIGTKRVKLMVLVKLSLLIGLFHIIMPLLGINIGYFLHNLFGNYYFEDTIDSVAQAIGSGVLMILGMLMIYDKFQNNKQESNFCLYGWSLFILALSVSIDALSVGFSLGMLDAKLILGCFILGGIATLMVILGLLLGGKVADVISDKAEILGGIALIVLGIHFLIS